MDISKRGASWTAGFTPADVLSLIDLHHERVCVEAPGAGHQAAVGSSQSQHAQRLRTAREAAHRQLVSDRWGRRVRSRRRLHSLAAAAAALRISWRARQAIPRNSQRRTPGSCMTRSVDARWLASTLSSVIDRVLAPRAARRLVGVFAGGAALLALSDSLARSFDGRGIGVSWRSVRRSAPHRAGCCWMCFVMVQCSRRPACGQPRASAFMAAVSAFCT